MSKIQERFYKNRAALNVLAGSIGNAKDIYEAAEGHVLVGVLSKNYANAREASAMTGVWTDDPGRRIDRAWSRGQPPGGGSRRDCFKLCRQSYQSGVSGSRCDPCQSGSKGQLD